MLVTGLSALRAETETQAAAPQLKAALLAAFAEQVTPAAAPVVATKVLPFRRVAVWPRWALAAAAALLLGVGSFALWLRTASEETNQPNLAQATRVQPSPTPAPVQVERPTAPSAPVAQPQAAPRRVRRTLPRRASESETNALTATTDFIPLTYAANAQPLQNGILMRVEVPRASLLAMGLPLNAERAAEKVKAEVMLGEDGVAYAIRLLQPAGQ